MLLTLIFTARRDPLIFFRRLFSEILMKNGTKTVPLIASATLAGPMSYDYRRKDLYWVGRDEREKSKVAPDTDDNKFGWRIHIHSVQDVGETAPRIFHNLSTPSKLAPMCNKILEIRGDGQSLFRAEIRSSTCPLMD